MRIRSVLLNVAVLASAGCGGATVGSASNPDGSSPGAEGGVDGGGPDTGVDGGHYGEEGGVTDGGSEGGTEAGQPEAACVGCGCSGGPPVPSGNATPAQACSIAHGFPGILPGNVVYSTGCQNFCTQIGNTAGAYYCMLPQAYITAYQDAQPDAGDAGYDAGPTCPAWSSDVVVTCGYNCTGRGTDGVAEVEARAGASTGAILAERAYLEAVSVHAFARLERELAAHGAPESLLRNVRRARRDEVRHTAMMTRLARRFGYMPRRFEPPPASPLRGLLAVALENAVEGCVRETYGAVVGLVEARVSRDPQVRRSMQLIAADECGHAELAWEVAAWILPRLAPEERDAVQCATQDAVVKLEREADAGIVWMLASRLWNREPGEARVA